MQDKKNNKNTIDYLWKIKNISVLYRKRKQQNDKGYFEIIDKDIQQILVDIRKKEGW